MERTMTLSLRESVHLVSDPANLDASVHEVFHLMLGADCMRDTEAAAPVHELVTAVVGLAGFSAAPASFARAGRRLSRSRQE